MSDPTPKKIKKVSVKVAAKPAEVKPAEPKPVETKAAEPKPVETKAAEPKPVETKAAEPKPVETKAAEPKPVEAKPAAPKKDELVEEEPKKEEPKKEATKKEKKPLKPVYKTWWFWLFIIAVVLCVVMNLSKGTSTKTVDATTTTAASTTTTTTTTTQSDGFNPTDVANQLSFTWSSYDDGLNEQVVCVAFNNPTQYDLNVSANVVMKDESGNSISAETEAIDNFEATSEWAGVYYCEKAPATVEVTFTVKQEPYYKPIAASLDFASATNGNTVIMTAQNKGTEPIQCLEYYVFYFSGDQLVGYGNGFISDNDAELKAGATQTASDQSYVNFDSVKVYHHGLMT